MDCVAHDAHSGRGTHIDTTCVDSLNKRAQGRAEPRRAVFADAIKGESVTYAAAAERHSALLITFVVDSNGGPQPRGDALQGAASPLDANHNAVMRAIFGATAKPPTRGALALPVEGGLLRKLARGATGHNAAGAGIMGATVSPATAAGMLAAQACRRIAYHATRARARASLASLRALAGRRLVARQGLPLTERALLL